MNRPQVIDSDGHIFEDIDAIAKYLPSEYAWGKPPLTGNLFPPLDHLHVLQGKVAPYAFGGGRKIGPAEWEEFLDDVGIESSYLYPSVALSFGNITSEDWAIASARAYNNWLADTYLSRSTRLKGIGLIPLQEPEAAVEELRRLVTELGMVGAMLPSNGLALPLGSKQFFPVYEEAERLGCALAVHGGNHGKLGFDHLNVFAPAHAMGHSAGIMNCFASILYNGVYDKFPGIRIGFLEAGVAWILHLMERFDGSTAAFQPYNLRGKLVHFEPGQMVSDYIIKQIKAGRIFIGCEGEEPILPYAVSIIGNEPFVYASDFPHEVNNETCKHDIEEILEFEGLTEADKAAILGGNSERFYKASSLVTA